MGEVSKTSDKIDERIEAKKQEVESLWESIRIYFQKDVDMKTKQRVDNLQSRLEFRLKKLEEEGLDEKVKIYRKLLNVLKNV